MDKEFLIDKELIMFLIPRLVQDHDTRWHFFSLCHKIIFIQNVFLPTGQSDFIDFKSNMLPSELSWPVDVL